MQYLNNRWYQFGWTNEVAAGQSLSRVMLEQPVVVWRTEDGDLSALLDRCPHRFAPLSAGSVGADRITCCYHGLSFGSDGACVGNPHGAITSAMAAATFPVHERHDAIWVWMGEARAADTSLVPDLSFIDDTPVTARIQATMWNEANYQLLTDNIIDLSHIDYIHPETLGRMMTTAKSRTIAAGDQITVEWSASDAATPLGYKSMVPDGNCDVWMRVVWSAPALMRLEVAVKPAGVPHGPNDVMPSVHNFTPASPTSSHYFLCSTRRFAVENEHITHHLREALMTAFLTEDKPMIEAQQARMGTADFWSLRPILLGIDSGAVQARRKLEAMIAAQASHSAAEAAIAVA